jgi:hypothetical protein
VSGWRKCDICRKVRRTDEFSGEAATCQICLTAPARKPRAASGVKRSTTTPKAPRETAAPAGQRAPLLGAVGSGDLEVRERRARRAAYEALAEQHQEEFAILLREARQAEGLRSSG